MTHRYSTANKPAHPPHGDDHPSTYDTDRETYCDAHEKFLRLSLSQHEGQEILGTDIPQSHLR